MPRYTGSGRCTSSKLENMRVLTQADQHRVNELRQRIGDGVPDTWLETAAVALNDKLAAEGDVELPNEPDAIVLALDVIIEEYGEMA